MSHQPNLPAACHRYRSVAVVVPVHNEQRVLPHCLRALHAAAAHVRLPVDVVVALDRCTDRSAHAVDQARAAGLAVRAVVSGRPGVGAARRAGARAALSAADPDSCWLATTDADSLVPPHWLSHQLRHAELGAEAVVGTVQVLDWSGHPARVRERYHVGYQAESGHRHMHGANLSVAARRYLQVGGFNELDLDEDVDLILRLESAGTAMVWAADLAVTTSARRDARAIGGFADYLTRLAGVTDVG